MRRLLLGGAVALIFGACFKDWDRVDPSKGTPPTTVGGSGGQGGRGAGGEPVGGDPGLCTPGEQVPCYTGPDGTRNVGVCQGGTTTCDADGMGFGACTDEVVPGAEICGNLLDDNCDGEVNELTAGCTCTPGTITTCYDGAMGTEDVGICHGGEKLCEASGESETLCAGQVIPRVEDCLTIEDDDCDNVVNEGCPSGGALFGGDGDTEPWDMAADAANGYAIGGETLASILNLGGMDLAGLGMQDAFIARYASNGAHMWSHRFGDIGDDHVYGVAMDDVGNVYVTGVFSGSIDIGQPSAPHTTAGGSDVFVIEFDSATGAPVWLTQLGDASLDEGYDIAVNAAGTVIAVTGTYSGGIDVGNGVEVANARDGFVVLLDGSGTVTAGKTFGENGNDVGNAVVLHGTDIHVGGRFEANMDFGGPPIAETAGGDDGFVAKLNAGLVQQWLNRIGGSGDEPVTHMAVDGDGNVIAYGQFVTDIEFGGASTMGQGADDVFVVKYSAAGTVMWEMPLGGAAEQTPAGIAVDNMDNVWFAVAHEVTGDYGGGPVHSAGADDWVVVKLDPMGANLATFRFGDNSDEDPRAVAARSDGSILVTGKVRGGMDFGQGFLVGSTSFDFLAVTTFSR